MMQGSYPPWQHSQWGEQPPPMPQPQQQYPSYPPPSNYPPTSSYPPAPYGPPGQLPPHQYWQPPPQQNSYYPPQDHYYPNTWNNYQSPPLVDSQAYPTPEPPQKHSQPYHKQQHQQEQDSAQQETAKYFNTPSTLETRIAALSSIVISGSKVASKIQSYTTSNATRVNAAIRRSDNEDAGFARLPGFQDFAGTLIAENVHDATSKTRILQEQELDSKSGEYVVKGTVEALRAFGLMIQLSDVYDLKGRATVFGNRIQALKIKGLCHISEVSNEYISDPEVLAEQYKVGDNVKALLLAVDIPNERISLSFKPSRIPADASIRELGLITETDHDGEINSRAFNDLLKMQTVFGNPYSLDAMTSYYGIPDLEKRLTEYPASHYYEKLRDYQNTQWARETVAKGITFAKQSEYKKAMQCYSQALEVDPEHRDAFVARGAAYANMNMLNEAVGEFERALKIDPDDRNARKYLAATREKLQQRDKDKHEAEKDRDRDRDRDKDKDKVDLEKKEKEDKHLDEKLKTLLLEEEERDRKRKKKKKKKEKKHKKHTTSSPKEKHKKHKHKSKRKYSELSEDYSSGYSSDSPRRKHHKSNRSP